MPRPRQERPNYRLTSRDGTDIWYITWTENRRTKLLSTRTAVRREAEQALAEFVAGLDAPAPPAEPTIADILDGYIADRTKKAQSLATLKSCAAALKRHLGDLQPGHISQGTIDRYADDRRLGGPKSVTPPTPGKGTRPARKAKLKPLSDGTIIRDLVTLRAAFRWARRAKWIPVDPMFEMPAQQPQGRERWFTPREAARLIDECKTPHLRLFVILALHTAARSSALLQLTWDRVDFTRGIILLDLPGRKRSNKRRAKVPMTEAARDALREAQAAATSDHVIEWREVSVKTTYKAYMRAARRARVLPCSPVTLRHTAATWMIMRRVPIRDIARYLGNTEKMVEQVYGHHSPEFLAGAAAAIDGAYERLHDTVAQTR